MRSIKNITLELQEFCTGRLLDNDVIGNLSPEAEVHFRADQAALIITAMMRVYGEKLMDEEYRHPAGWWQWFKKDHLPTFAKFYPVKYTLVEFKASALYPSIPVRQLRPKYHQVQVVQ